MDQKDVVSWTAMVSAYAKIGDLTSAKLLFDQMPVKNLVSWNAMITGYNHNSRYDEALHTFQQMMLEGRFMPDEGTLVSVVSACGQLGSSEYSNWISSYISKRNAYITVPLGNALIDMFAKCGDVGRAWFIFEKMKERCIITWTTMISGFAFNGRFREALSIYNDMCREGVELDDTVFIAVLAACAHGGLLGEGWSIFKQMVEHYRIRPRMEHYGCIVDLLGRAGKLKEAVQFIETLPLKPGVVLWVTLLSSCVAHGDAELINYVSKQVMMTSTFGSMILQHDALLRHFESIHTRNHAKRLARIDLAHGCRRVRLAAALSLNISKYEKVAHEIAAAATGPASPAEELRHAGVRPELTRTAAASLRERARQVLDEGSARCLVLVFSCEELASLLPMAKERGVRSVVVGGESGLARLADVGFSWADVVRGKARNTASFVSRKWRAPMPLFATMHFASASRIVGRAAPLPAPPARPALVVLPSPLRNHVEMFHGL
ncbi:hypothetical protein PR202_ga30454 [Eleusine coracana subsp. coracana]|uniref:Pentatricopeptide repeat-containing protein n=1 Tax=Eleusine coracana subsp. coracana TaxID=191504 RepID=A0AAV5DNU5_ELECO|nr:hypothetical protein PR202_ga30454 [Eleusine coracana subsp. coracana]